MDYEHDYYLNSLCSEGLWLHDYQIVKTYEDCVVERCEKCKNRQIFKIKGSNKRYLSYHIRPSLQPRQKRFSKEYPNII